MSELTKSAKLIENQYLTVANVITRVKYEKTGVIELVRYPLSKSFQRLNRHTNYKNKKIPFFLVSQFVNENLK